MLRKEASKLVRKAQKLGIPEVSYHRYGNKFEWAVEFIGYRARTVYTPEQGEEFLQHYKAGHLTDEYKEAESRGWQLVNEARALLGLPPVDPIVYS